MKPRMAYTLFFTTTTSTTSTTTTKVLVFSIPYSLCNQYKKPHRFLIRCSITSAGTVTSIITTRKTSLRMPILSSHTFTNLFNLTRSLTGCAG
jgi:hypothetical protein